MSIIAFDGHRPLIDETAWVAATATIIGRVHVAKDSSIFYGAVLRADLDEIRLEAGSNVQDNVVIHTDINSPVTIGVRARVGHAAVVHGCTIEEGCLIGMNATVLTGAVIGAGSLVAAGAVVLANTQVPSGSLVAGVPATIHRSLTEEERLSILRNTNFYAKLACKHRSANFAADT